MVQDGGKLVLITNRKSHTGFQLVPKSLTLNDLERRNGQYFALFRPIRYSFLLISHHLPRNVIKYTNLARRTRCALRDSGASCFIHQRKRTWTKLAIVLRTRGPTTANVEWKWSKITLNAHLYLNHFATRIYFPSIMCHQLNFFHLNVITMKKTSTVT